MLKGSLGGCFAKFVIFVSEESSRLTLAYLGTNFIPEYA